MKLNNRFIFGILSLVLAAVIAFVALPTIARQTNGKTEIVRITQPVLKGEQVTKENAEVVEVGGYNLPTNVAHSLEDVEGLYVTADLAAGDYILTSKVSSVPISSDVALNDIPSGKVAISLTVKTLASGLSDKLQPNDIVRIYHFLETAEEVPELRFVKVLSVTDSDGINVDNTKEPTEDEEPQQSATITVLASPEQARIITELENDNCWPNRTRRSRRSISPKRWWRKTLTRKAASLPPREAPKTPKGASLKPSPLKAARRIANNQGGESLHRPGFTIRYLFG